MLDSVVMLRAFNKGKYWIRHWIKDAYICGSSKRFLQNQMHGFSESGAGCYSYTGLRSIFSRELAGPGPVPSPRLDGNAREMSSSGLEKWRKLMTKFQETKMEKDGLTRYFINRDVGYGEFNKFGRINPWCIVDYFEASINLFNVDTAEFGKGSLFARQTEMQFRQGIEAEIHPDKALKFKIWVSYVGKSTVCWDAQCLDPTTEEELAHYVIQMVTIDLKVRKPVPYAHLFKDSCPKNLRDQPPRGFDLEFKPEDAFKHRFVVNWSDTDFNSHLNQVDMHRMCIDCGSFAALENKLSAFRRELVSYDLKRSSVMFMKEARPGEEVLVECWQSETSPLILNFAFSKEGDLITMVQLEYHAGDEV